MKYAIIISLVFLLFGFLFYLTKFSKMKIKSWVFLFFSCIILLAFLASLLFGKPDIKNEDQLFYLSSTLAQVCATLYSITIAAYVFLEDKLNREVQQDETLSDIVKLLKSSYRAILIFNGLLVFITIAFCMWNIVIDKDTDSAFLNFKLVDVVFSNMCIFALTTVTSVLTFVYKVTNPNKYIKANNQAIIKMKIASDTESSKEYTAEYLKAYNELEKDVMDIAKSNFIHFNDDQLTFTKCIDYLKTICMIDSDLHSKLNDAREVRNYIIHGNDIYISKNLLDDLIATSKQFRNITKSVK